MESELSKRERAILDILYERGRASAAEVQEGLGDGTSNSAVRTLLGILEGKGFARHEAEGKRFVYAPTVGAFEAGRSALRRAVRTFFRDSAGSAIVALAEEGTLKPEDIARLEELIAAAKKGEAR